MLVSSSCDLADDCDRSGCEYTDSAVANPGISTGIAGGASSASDMVTNGCAECTFASGDLWVWSAAAPVTSAEEARAIYDGGEVPLATVSFDGKYAQELAPGEYLVCLPNDGESEAPCAGVSVPAGGVVTLHVLYVFGPTSFALYPAGSGEPAPELVFSW